MYCSCDLYTNSRANKYPYTYTNSYTYAHSNANSNADTYPCTDFDAKTDNDASTGLIVTGKQIGRAHV